MEGSEKGRIVPLLLQWYDKNARELAWRSDPTPYHVWVSEIMLQQTRVEAVKPFYERFLQRLPSIADLAVCPEDQLLKLWEGLGYYSRVRNMQKAARILQDQYEGKLPADPKLLEQLPGIGPYTAGAIASIAYHQPAPAVDGNVLRVFSRIFEQEEDIADPRTRKQIEQIVTEIIPQHCPDRFNQALMELGALLCLPNGTPHCGECPVRECCLACQKGRQAELPHKKSPFKRKIEEKTVLLLRYKDRFAICRRPRKGLLSGLYEFPNLPGHLEEEAVREYLEKEQLILDERVLLPVRIEPLGPARHIFSHVEWHMLGYEIELEQQTDLAHKASNLLKMQFVTMEQTRDSYPIPAAFSSYINYLKLQETAKKKGK